MSFVPQAIYATIKTGGAVRNQEYDEYYIHRTHEAFAKNYGNAESQVKEIQEDTYRIYKEQASRLRKRFIANNNLENIIREEDVPGYLKAVSESVNALTSGELGASLEKAKGYWKDPKRLMKIGEECVSFYSFGGRKDTSKELMDKVFSDVKLLEQVVTTFGDAVDGFEACAKEREAIEAMMDENPPVIPTKEWAGSLKQIYEDGKTDKGVKKLIAAKRSLQDYLKQVKNGDTENLRVTEEDAREILRGIKGSINNVAGGYFEIAVKNMFKNNVNRFLGDIVESGKGGITITETDMQGDDTIEHPLVSSRKFTSKTDVWVEGVFGDGPHFKVGFSLKTTDMSQQGKNGQWRSTSALSGANFRDALERVGLLNDESIYYMSNSLVHAGASKNSETGEMSYSKQPSSNKVYKAFKERMAAQFAFDALAGIGTREDTAYFIMYQSKLVNIADFLEELSKRPKDRIGTEHINMTLAGAGAFAEAARKKLHGQNNVVRWERSHQAMKLFLGLKIQLTARTA